MSLFICSCIERSSLNGLYFTSAMTMSSLFHCFGALPFLVYIKNNDKFQEIKGQGDYSSPVSTGCSSTALHRKSGVRGIFLPPSVLMLLQPLVIEILTVQHGNGVVPGNAVLDDQGRDRRL